MEEEAQGTGDAVGETATQAIEAVGQQAEAQFEYFAGLVNQVGEFIITYGFQLLGALFVFLLGLKGAGWVARRVVRIARRNGLDETLSRFFGNVVRVGLLILLVIVTLGNFGISIAPLIAVAGAGAFGLTVALQGPLSNYGAGLVIIATRPFSVGDTIAVKGTYGVVRDIALAHTKLEGEDGERITVPNRDVVGAILVNSESFRVVETRITLAHDQDVEKARDVVLAAIKKELPTPEVKTDEAGDDWSFAPEPQVGVEDFTNGGVILGARYWVPSLSYFSHRYRVNGAALKALKDADVSLRPALGELLSPRTVNRTVEVFVDEPDPSLQEGKR
jgi:small conductance mechanosensitive channel